MEEQVKQTDVEVNEADETNKIGEPIEETVGDIMKKAPSDAIKFWVVLVSALVYIAGIVYAEVHGITMLRNGIAPEMRMWAMMGMIAAGVTALALPIALKVWTIEAKQRIGAYVFYALDFAFLAFNAFTDFNVNTGQQLAGWAQSYVNYILPASPIIVAFGWAMLWELDPSVKEKVMLLSLRAAMKQKMASKVAEAAKGANVTATVNAAAEREVERALTELFGHPVYRIEMNSNAEPTMGGLLKGFFGSLLQRAQRAYLSDTPSQSNLSNSGKENK